MKSSPAGPARLGHFATLPILRFGSPGAFLALDPADPDNGASVLLLGPEIPEGAREGDEVSVFLTLDSEGRPLATTRTPKLILGDVAFLSVTSVTTFGAFVDWGLPKELLVPFAEQTTELRPGDRHPIGLYLDDSGRFAGTMRVSELLRGRPDVKPGAWVEGEAWRYDRGIGVFVIAERRWVGLVPKSEPSTLRRGEAARFRVSNVLGDGKVELSRRAVAHEAMADDAAKILATLRENPSLDVGDQTSPETIFQHFGVSKKAFKRAVGKLLRERKVTLDAQGQVRPVG